MNTAVFQPSFEEYQANLSSAKIIVNGSESRFDAIERHYRILSCLLPYNISGPTLDVACGNGVFYPSIKKYKPEMLPYSVTELDKRHISIDGDLIECHEFECEKTLIPIQDNSIGCIMFCDVIEHLLIDPVWTILEFNRVLRPDGHLIISTPNACHINRVTKILNGYNSATENHYKPTSVYQRHNREWTLTELNTLLLLCGFFDINYSTQSYLLTENEVAFIKIFSDAGITKLTQLDFGPEIFILGRKKEHKTLDSVTALDERWPDWLYTHYSNYRRRPEVFPIIVGKDYG